VKGLSEISIQKYNKQFLHYCSFYIKNFGPSDGANLAIFSPDKVKAEEKYTSNTDTQASLIAF
jgi:hypothetical protein